MLDPHWIKELYKGKSDEELSTDLIFASDQEALSISAELERRERETKQKNRGCFPTVSCPVLPVHMHNITK